MYIKRETMQVDYHISYDTGDQHYPHKADCLHTTPSTRHSSTKFITLCANSLNNKSYHTNTLQ